MLERLARRPLVCAALACLIGAAAGSALNVPAVFWGAGAVASGAIVWWKRGAAIFAALMLLFAMEAAYLRQRPMPAPREGASLTGEVCAEPSSDGERTVLTLSNAALDGEALAWNMRVYAYEPVPAGLGDRVSMTVETWLPDGRKNPYGFDFDAWCRRNGVACATMQAGTAKAMPGAPSPRTALRRVRARVGAAIDNAFSGGQAPLARALILGDRSELSQDVADDFRRAGIAHILSVSGLHVTCLALALDHLLRRLLSRRAVFFLMTLLLVFYAALVGFSGPIVRASAMYLAFRFAPMTGRPGDGLSALSAAALMMLAANPLTVGDAGFILSFSAMAGLILLGRPLARFLKTASTPRWARPFLKAFTASVAASVATLPAQINLFGAAQPYGPLVNLLAVPMVTAAMPLMFLAAPAQMLFPAAGFVFAWPSSILLAWTSWLAAFASGLPFASAPLGHVPWWLCGVWAVGVYLMSDHAGLRVRWKPALLLLMPAALAASISLHALAAPKGLAIDFLSVGEADAAVVHAQGRTYLVDAGEGNAAAQYLAQTGCALRAMFLTHPHDDHIGGAGEVQALYPNATVYVPECWARVEGVREAEARARLKGPFVALSAGDEVRLSDDVTARVLYPPKGLNPLDPNDASLVLLIENGDGSALLTGDLGDASVLDDIPDVDILKAAHHGADIKGAEFLLRAATPGVVAVSAGLNSGNHPSAAFLSRTARLGQAVFRTDQSGMLRASLGPGGTVTITPFLSPSKEEPW